MPNEAQQAAIDFGGGPVLVSAAAGSGKTTVLSQRCVRLVCDGSDRCDIDRLLIVTFTRAAADEMRHRIDRDLRTRAESSDDPHIQRQLRLLPRASITTIHSFCWQLVRRHFTQLSLDPSVRLLDEKETRLVRSETARDEIDHRLAGGDAELTRFLDEYCGGSEEAAVRTILELDALHGSLVDPQAWTAAALSRVAAGFRDGDAPLRRSLHALAGSLLDGERKLLEALEEDALAEVVPDVARFARFSCDRLAQRVTAFEKHGLDGVVGFDALAVRAPSIKWSAMDDATAARWEKRVKAVKRQLDANRVWLGRFTVDQLHDGLAAVLQPATILTQLVERWSARYSAVKRDMNAVDFADLERMCLQLLEDRDIAEAARARFDHVLVDEYQDVNELQDRLIALLSGEHADPDRGGNLFCVGDVKQSIYRFRLADPRRYLLRIASLAPLSRVIRLQSNYRTRGPLLEAINRVFERLMTESAAEIAYDDTHRLSAGREFTDHEHSPAGCPIEMLIVEKPGATAEQIEGPEPADDTEELATIEREGRVIAQKIASWLGRDGSPPLQINDQVDGQPVVRPLRAGDIAILLRSPSKRLHALVSTLAAEGVPVVSASRSGFFASQETRDVMSLLRILSNRRQDVPLAAVLKSPMFEIDDPDFRFAEIRARFPGGRDGIAFHQAVVLYAADDDAPASPHFRAALASIDQWRQLARHRPVAEVLAHIFNETSLLTTVQAMRDGGQRAANLRQMLALAVEFASFQRSDLSRFLEYLERLEEDADLGAAQPPVSLEDAVSVLSVHASKGLEFPVVVLVDLATRFNTQSLRGSILIDRLGGIAPSVVDASRALRYPSAATLVARDGMRRQQISEELRVLYVAMTRAKEKLVLVASVAHDDAAVRVERHIGLNGAFPDEAIVGAMSFADWLLAVGGAEGPQTIAIDYVATPESSRRRELDVGFEALRKLQPVDPPLPARHQAGLLIAAVSETYPHAFAAQTAAAISVTTLAKAQPDRDEERDGAPSLDSLRPIRLQDHRVLATDLGNATHLLLERLDWRVAHTPATLESEAARLVADQAITAQQAAALDVDGVLWLLRSTLGDRVRAARTVRRELPILVREPIDSRFAFKAPQDCRLVRGRIDLVLDEPIGLAIADFKTDHGDSQTLQSRLPSYSAQLRLYAESLSRITGRPVVDRFLVFLASRQLLAVVH